MEEEAHEEVEAQKEKDEGKVWSMITIIELKYDIVKLFHIGSIIIEAIEMLLFFVFLH